MIQQRAAELNSLEAQLEYAHRVREIEYEYIKPFLKPVVDPRQLDNEEKMGMVEEAFDCLSQEDRIEMNIEKQKAYMDVLIEYGELY